MAMLDTIVAHKRAEVGARRRAVPPEALRDRPLHAEPRRGMRAALARNVPRGVIAELKRASPSRGTIRTDYDVPALARAYAAAGATALSVLTDERFFHGALEHLAAARAATALPCLRKDFLVDPYQVEEARAWGADAVLLIAAALAPEEGASLLAVAAESGLDVLVEVHGEAELAWALAAGATFVGINNRDLATFAVSLDTTERLAGLVPGGVLVVAESGIRSRADVERMRRGGAHAVLVGEAFMERPDPGAALAEWLACP
ncbi:MAG: indole-3-glycerol phosphate synthase TrpC [Deltaproteobacteria bacterium]|nr:MAG: indole-3-glycerol phosphate synthase TrpC [Deltaproteobacteria bacterium]